ncbi:uncharacterized protein B0I36DRAFT_358150 [Microdochium trichocladiopsis]|uniref:Uncharacterized protein n=1 Tax=Microdochium trichocladiopsis TaxID=1682393 RepID=A0A9P8YJ90_9PEZI|nr:uncharacterized protein B0I36DRAFT_358150 [Microdochium trichocladiopsis]KAH7040923.1 hypothetical protein B0I36DRAFT_358150 [Microdochium trichocladiopsis]
MQDDANPHPSGVEPDFVARYAPLSRASHNVRQSSQGNPQPKAFKHDLFARLNWPLWEPLSNIRVLAVENLTEDRPMQWQPLFNDALEPVHAIAGLPTTHPPRSRMIVHIATIDDHDWWQDSCLMGQRPAPLVIDRTTPRTQVGGGQSIITVADFVREVGAYLETQPLRAAYEEIFHPRPGEPADRALFQACSGPRGSQVADPEAPFRLSFMDGHVGLWGYHWLGVRKRLLHRAAAAAD